MSASNESTSRKSTFAKRQKHFVRNFLTEQFSSNQLSSLLESRNPLNRNATQQRPKPVVVDEEKFFKKSARKQMDLRRTFHAADEDLLKNNYFNK